MSVTYQVLADRLHAAYAGPAIPPLRDGLEPGDASGAYAVQAINTARWRDAGRRVIGHKIGLTAKAVQTQLGVDQPDFGVLFADMSIPNGGHLPASRVLQPKVEAEIALVFARDLMNPAATMADVAAATDYAAAAIEIVDSRIEGWKIAFSDTVADNGSAAFFVLGAEKRTLQCLDLSTCGMVLEINGKMVSFGVGAACLDHPLNAAAWLARTMAANNSRLRAGDIVLTGALGPMATLSRGDRIEAKIGGIGNVNFTYAEEG